MAQHHDSARAWFEEALGGTETIGFAWIALLADVGTAANIINDAHLAALALEHGATVVSYDRDFARFAGLSVMTPA
jgi:predicted nucleic acid-binding protein